MVRHRVASSRVPRILIIERERFLAHLIGEVVKGIGYSVSGLAHDVAVVRYELIKRNFDAVLLDVGFDGRYGTAITESLIEAAIPFAFLTGHDKGFEPRHISVPLLQKPFTPDQLHTLLAKLVGRRRPAFEQPNEAMR
jgi:DNA-binding response OmpR family regulator